MYVVQVLEDLLGAQVVQARHAAVHVALHGEGLAGASLAVCETCDFGPQEGAVDEGLDAGVINLLVVGVFVKSVVEVEVALLHVLGEVDLLPASNRIHLISLIRTVFWSRIRIISVSPRASSFLFRGRFRITTVILGGSCFEYISFESLIITEYYPISISRLILYYQILRYSITLNPRTQAPVSPIWRSVHGTSPTCSLRRFLAAYFSSLYLFY